MHWLWLLPCSHVQASLECGCDYIYKQGNDVWQPFTAWTSYACPHSLWPSLLPPATSPPSTSKHPAQHPLPAYSQHCHITISGLLLQCLLPPMALHAPLTKSMGLSHVQSNHTLISGGFAGASSELRLSKWHVALQSVELHAAADAGQPGCA